MIENTDAVGLIAADWNRSRAVVDPSALAESPDLRRSSVDSVGSWSLARMESSPGRSAWGERAHA